MEDFVGFRFGNWHTKDLHLKVVSTSNRYIKNLLPTPQDYTLEIPGGDGKYYFGQTFQPREFSVNIAFDNLDESTWRLMSQIFSTDHLRDLVFDENPYKTYRAKLKQAPDMKFICFRDRETQQRVYKGEGTLQFICYHPLAYCFNKYVVRAADYYKCMPPEHIIDNKSIQFNEYRSSKEDDKFMLPGEIKDHYNWESNLDNPCDTSGDLIYPYRKYPNMNYGWPGGYPTIRQVQNGELYFKDIDPKTGKENNKMIIDVRGYWNNIPKWEGTAKLLTTPTLDYDQELIYLPQYSKCNYYNMEIGLKRENGLIGSRLLVYNPGDVPVDFELRLNNIDNEHKRGVWDVQNRETYKFRISRYNVQRLTLSQVVDWTGLKCYDAEHNKDDKYKYGPNYFRILEPDDTMTNSGSTIKGAIYREPKAAHPKHAYIVEPIPKEHMAHFIRLFYWQTCHLQKNYKRLEDNKKTPKTKWNFSYADGVNFANRYQELYQLCRTEDEKNELYWHTLHKLLRIYADVQSEIFNENNNTIDYKIDEFIYDYIHNPLEYIRINPDYDYGEFTFNAFHMPQWMTFDYFDINNNNFDKLVRGGVDDVSLFLNTESRMLYNIKAPDEIEEPPVLLKTFTHYKPQKVIYNDNIEKGHWFQLPPGWSLIDISPIVNETMWGGKRWLDARPFTWGKNGNEEAFRRDYNLIYREAAAHYLAQKQPEDIFKRYEGEPFYKKDNETVTPVEIDNGTTTTINEKTRTQSMNSQSLLTFIRSLSIADIDSYLQFRLWHENGLLYKEYSEYKLYNYSDIDNSFGYELNEYRWERDEIGFLRTLADIWRINHSNDGVPDKNNDIDKWWWFANNYIWDNFPPLYWGYADLLTDATIKYVPQYY